MEEHIRISRLLRDEIEKNRRKAAELAKEGMDKPAKQWLAVSLACKDRRNKIEAFMAHISSIRIELLTKPEHPPSKTLQQVSEMLRESATERERTTREFGRVSTLLQLSAEQAMSELESYGVKERVVNEEFQRLKEEAGMPLPAEGEEIEEAALPEVPKERIETKAPSKKEKEAEKAN